MFNPFARRLELAVKIDDSWAFQANGAPHLVIGAFNGWLAVVNDSHEGSRALLPRRETRSTQTLQHHTGGDLADWSDRVTTPRHRNHSESH